MRLPLPSWSMKRYQYSRAGLSPPTSTRAVQSAAAETGTEACETTRRKAASSATSTVSSDRSLRSNGRRVQRMTLVGSGSPEATPSGKRSRRSVHLVCEARAAPPQASDAPIAAASWMKSRRLSATRCSCTSGCVSFILVDLGSFAVWLWLWNFDAPIAVATCSLCDTSSHLYEVSGQAWEKPTSRPPLQAHGLLKVTPTPACTGREGPPALGCE